MSQTRHSYIIRLEAEGGKTVTATIEQLGVTGERSMNRVGDGALKANQKIGLLARTMLTQLVPAIGAYQAASSTFSNMQQFERLEARLKFLTGSTEELAAAQEFLRTKARELNIDIFALSDGYGRLLALQKGGIINQDITDQILVGLANAKAVFGAADAQIGQVLYGMGQAFSQVRVETAEFNQIMEPLPGFIENVGRAAGVTGAELKQMVKDGEVSGKQLAEWVAKATKDFEGAAQELDGGIVAALSDLNNAWKELSATLGDSDLITGPLAEAIQLFADAATGASILVGELDKLHEAAKRDYSIVPPAMDAEGKALPTVAGAAAYDQRIREQMGDLSSTHYGWSPKWDPSAEGGISSPPVPVPASKPEEIILRGDKEREKVIKQAHDEAEAIRKVIDQLRIRNEEMNLSEATQEVNNRLREAGVDIFSREGEEIARLVYQYHEMRDAQEESADRAKMLADAVRGGRAAFEDLGDYALDTLAEIAAAFVELDAGTGKGSGLGGLIAGGLFNLLGGIGGGGGGLQRAGNGLPLPPPNKPSASGGLFDGFKLFSKGGISDRPAIFGEGPLNEAAVPLPDGRTIPVTLKGDTPKRSAASQYFIDATNADQGAVERLSAQLRALGSVVERIDGEIGPRAVEAVMNKYSRNGTYLRA